MRETARLRLREPQSGDVDLLRAYFRRNAARFDPWGEGRSDDAAVHEEWIAARHAERQGDVPVGFLAFEAASGAPAAIVVLTGFSSSPRSAMLNYTVDGAFEGTGIAYEAVRAVLDHAFETLGLTSVTAHYDPENRRSERLLQRLGFREIARMPALALPHQRERGRGQVLMVIDRPER